MNPNLAELYAGGVWLWCDGPQTSVCDCFCPPIPGGAASFIVCGPSNA